jgi:hypothetical protein
MTAAIGEQLLHHPNLGPREDVAGRVGVMLDLRADGGVDIVVGGEHGLELVEDHQDPGASALRHGAG